MARTKQRKALGIVLGLIALAITAVALWQFGVLEMVSPPRYEVPAGVSAEERRAIMVAQDAAREEKGRFVRFEGTTIFENQFGNYRVRGAVRDPFSTDKAVFVYQAIVDSKSFERLEFGFD